MKKVLPIVIIVAALAGAVYYFAAQNDNNSYGNGSSSQTTPSNNDQNPPVATDKVTIADMAFAPAKITVKKGTTVTWTNQDSVAHNVITTGGQGPKSKNLEKGASYSFTFDTVGTFDYECTIHPSMTGTVTVTE